MSVNTLIVKYTTQNSSSIATIFNIIYYIFGGTSELDVIEDLLPRE